jgi:hypothetical protein
MSLSDILSFEKRCGLCKVQLELNTCAVCNYFVDICWNCTNNYINDFFSDKDINYYLTGTYPYMAKFIKLVTENPHTFCKRCTSIGLNHYYTDTSIYIEKIKSLINLHVKGKFRLYLDLSKNIKHQI